MALCCPICCLVAPCLDICVCTCAPIGLLLFPGSGRERGFPRAQAFLALVLPVWTGSVPSTREPSWAAEDPKLEPSLRFSVTLEYMSPGLAVVLPSPPLEAILSENMFA